MLSIKSDIFIDKAYNYFYKKSAKTYNYKRLIMFCQDLASKSFFYFHDK